MRTKQEVFEGIQHDGESFIFPAMEQYAKEVMVHFFIHVLPGIGGPQYQLPLENVQVTVDEYFAMHINKNQNMENENQQQPRERAGQGVASQNGHGNSSAAVREEVRFTGPQRGEGTYTPPPPPEPKMKPREIHIQTLDHGYMVVCGCKTVCVESKHKLLAALDRYFTDAGAAEADFFAGKLL